MRTPYLLTATVLVASLSGCLYAPRTAQVPADNWVDEQIAQSATAISLAQRQLHTSGAAPALTPSSSTSSSGTVANPAQPRPSAPMLASTSATATTLVPPTAANSKPAVPVPAREAVPSKAAVAVQSIAPNKDFAAAPVKAPPPVVVPAAPVISAAHSAVTAPVKKVVLPPPEPKPVWEARVGDSLRKVITSWSQRSGYTLSWQADELDYPIEAPLRFEGSYEDAVASIFQLYEKADRSFVVDGRRAQHLLNVAEDHNKSKRAAP